MSTVILYGLCQSVCFYQITEGAVHLLPMQVQKSTTRALIIYSLSYMDAEFMQIVPPKWRQASK